MCEDMKNEEDMKKVQDAVDVLYGRNITDAAFLAAEFEQIHRAFAYNFILAGEDALMSTREACNSLSTLEMMIDGLRGKHLN